MRVLLRRDALLLYDITCRPRRTAHSFSSPPPTFSLLFAYAASDDAASLPRHVSCHIHDNITTAYAARRSSAFLRLSCRSQRKPAAAAVITRSRHDVATARLRSQRYTLIRFCLFYRFSLPNRPII